MLFATDLSWWQSASGERARREFKGELWTSSPDVVEKYPQINFIPRKPGGGVGNGFVFTGGGNSGYQAVNLALQWGASEVILLGFTMKRIGGKNHWHPDHRTSNPNITMLDRWAKELTSLARKRNIKVYGESAIDAPKVESIVPKCAGVIAVARSGGWVTPDYPARLYADTGALVLTDMELPFDTMPFQYDWQGWWAKMEIFRPDIKGDWLYMDMDTLVVGDITPLLEFGRLGLLGDFYHPKLETGVMYLTEWARAKVWERWIQDPERWMREYRGDGDFIRDTIGEYALDLREHVDGLHSYKVNGRKPDTRLLIYHGQPRPHQTEHW